MAEIGIIIAVISLLVAAWLLLRRRTSDSDDEDDSRMVEDTVYATKEFESTEATITYTDGRTETIEYDETDLPALGGDSMATFAAYDDDSFTVVDGEYWKNPPAVETDVPTENKWFINLDSVQEITVNRTRGMVAVAAVPVTKVQERRFDEWATINHLYNIDETGYDFDIWTVEEWEAAKSDSKECSNDG